MICEATTDEDVNETEDVVYEELDNLPNGDAARVPKGVSYVLDEGHLRVPIELNGTITATATVYSDLPDQALEFKYNVDGLRTQKKLTKPDKSTVTTDYILHGDQVNHVTITEADASGAVTATNNLHFYYDAANRPIALDFNGDKFFYAHNVHSDINAILDSNGAIVVEYKYNAWGELLATTGTLATTLGKLNPFRYRGYVYDEESGLYYLGSRYYYPKVQRFINTDSFSFERTNGAILDYNIFAYCKNNPVNMYDPDGHCAEALYYGYLAGGVATGAANFWNPLGWLVLGVLGLGVVIWAGVQLANVHKSKQNAAVSSAQALMNYASTAATPPPPNKGGKGTQTTSKTLYNKKGVHIDVENPGNRLGQIHLQKDGVKYYYNIAEKVFRVGSSTGKLAPDAIQQLLKDPNVIKAIGKGLTILGY